MMKPDRQDWAELLRLLDTALDLPEAEREVWLLAVSPAQQAQLRELLADRAALETADFLAKPAALPAESADTTSSAQAGQRVGPWRLIREIGSGGMAWVWLAERADGQGSRRVALKLPRLGWASGLAERMARERDILATLEHPHIARLYDAGVDEQGRPWLALEHVQGQPIDVYARERGLDVPQRVALLLQVADAVAYAHQRLVIHRDLKPSNVLVTADGQVRLLDFGIAKLMQDDRTQASTLTQASGRAWTPRYASPEQVLAQPLGTASDVYSLGVVAYELLAGGPPYKLERGTAAELEEAILQADILAPSQVAESAEARRALRGDLDAVVLMALNKRADERYASVEAFAADLRHAQNNEPVSAQRDSRWYRPRKLVLRHKLESGVLLAMLIAVPAGAGAQAAVMASLAAGAAATLWQGRKAREQARVAQAQAERAEQVKKLSLSLFDAADTMSGATSVTSAADLLRAAAERLDAEPRIDKRTAAELRLALATSMTNLGLVEDCLRLGRQALAATEQLGAAAGALHADALIQVGEALAALGHLEEGEQMLGRTLALPLEPMQAVNARVALAKILHLSGRAEEGLPAIREACEGADRLLALGADKAVLNAASAYKFLAYQLKMTDRPGRAVAARRAYELALQTAGGRESVLVAEAALGLADAVVNEGDALAGLAQMRVAVETLQRLVPEANETSAASLNWLMIAQDACGDVHAALDTQRELLARMPGARSRFGAFNQHHHGGIGRAGHHLFGDLPALKLSVQIAEEVMPGTPNAAMFACWLAGAELAAGQTDQAQATLARVPAADLALQQPQIQTTRAELFAALGQCPQALAQAQAAMAALVLMPTMRHSHLMLRCVAVALAAGEAVTTLGWIDQLRRHVARGQLDSSPVLADAYWLAARAHTSLGQDAEAAVAAKQALSRWRRFDAQHVRIAQIEASVGSA